MCNSCWAHLHAVTLLHPGGPPSTRWMCACTCRAGPHQQREDEPGGAPGGRDGAPLRAHQQPRADRPAGGGTVLHWLCPPPFLAADSQLPWRAWCGYCAATTCCHALSSCCVANAAGRLWHRCLHASCPQARPCKPFCCSSGRHAVRFWCEGGARQHFLPDDGRHTALQRLCMHGRLEGVSSL